MHNTSCVYTYINAQNQFHQRLQWYRFMNDIESPLVQRYTFIIRIATLATQQNPSPKILFPLLPISTFIALQYTYIHTQLHGQSCLMCKTHDCKVPSLLICKPCLPPLHPFSPDRPSPFLADPHLGVHTVHSD